MLLVVALAAAGAFHGHAVASPNVAAANQGAAAKKAATAPVAPVAQSQNWSGYVLPSSSAPVTAASGRWTVPTLDCATSPNSGASAWVGIGGASRPGGGMYGSLLQTGIRTDCINGVQANLGWVEQFPSVPNVEQDFAGLVVTAGDSMLASVSQAPGGAWQTRLDDLTTGMSGWMMTGTGWGVAPDSSGNVFAQPGSPTTLSYSGGYSAEWIVEDYSVSTGPVPLARFGTVVFTGLTTSLSRWSLTAKQAVQLVQGTKVIAAPSAPAGNGFSVTRVG
jgi:peptidase A4-like protein